MNFDSDFYEYLSGKKFSCTYQMKISGQRVNRSRIECILNLVSGKKVIHIGCCDHLEFIKRRVRKEQYLLHDFLVQNCKSVIGIDNQWESVELFREKIGFDDIYCMDLLQDGKALRSKLFQRVEKDGPWDYVLLGEVLEHIDDPVLFLQNILGVFRGIANQIIITVPNAFAGQWRELAKENIEQINTDHRYWFTPFTIAKVMYQAGLMIEELNFADPYIPASIKNLLQEARNKGIHFGQISFDEQHPMTKDVNNPMFAGTLISMATLNFNDK